MKRTPLVLSAALSLAAAVSSPALAQGAIRPGDDSLSCEALSAEVGKLEDAEARRAQRAEAGRKLLGFAGSALASAARGKAPTPAIKALLSTARPRRRPAPHLRARKAISQLKIEPVSSRRLGQPLFAETQDGLLDNCSLHKRRLHVTNRRGL